MKRFYIFCLCFAMIVAVVWGGGTREKQEGDVIILEFFQQKREVVDLFEQIISSFEAKNPGIRIEQVHIADAGQVLTSRLASNDVPELLTHWPNSVAYIEAALEGYYVDLTDKEAAQGVIPSVIESIKLSNGRNYAVPISINTQGVFYNKALFIEYGLEIPKTWEEFTALCRSIKNAGGQPLVFGDRDSWTIGQQVRMMLELDLDGYDLIDAVKAGKADARNSDELKAMAQKLLDIREFGQKDPMGTSYEQAIFEFANGNSFMFWQGIWAIPSINKANPDLDYSMFPLPAEKGRETRVEYGVDLALVVGNTSPKVQEAALKFVEFVASHEIGQLYADEDGSPSAIKGVEFKNEVSRPVVEYVQEGKSFRNIRHKYAPGGTPRINTAIQQLMVDNNIDAFLSEMNYAFGMPE